MIPVGSLATRRSLLTSPSSLFSLLSHSFLSLLFLSSFSSTLIHPVLQFLPFRSASCTLLLLSPLLPLPLHSFHSRTFSSLPDDAPDCCLLTSFCFCFLFIPVSLRTICLSQFFRTSLSIFFFFLPVLSHFCCFLLCSYSILSFALHFLSRRRLVYFFCFHLFPSCYHYLILFWVWGEETVQQGRKFGGSCFICMPSERCTLYKWWPHFILCHLRWKLLSCICLMCDF